MYYLIMEPQQETIKPYELILTDMQLHTIKHTNPSSVLRQIFRSIKNKMSPGRFYGKIQRTEDGKVRFSVPMSKDLHEQFDIARRLGRPIRILMPKDGIPIYLGKDSIERLKANQKKMAKLAEKLKK